MNINFLQWLTNSVVWSRHWVSRRTRISLWFIWKPWEWHLKLNRRYAITILVLHHWDGFPVLITLLALNVEHLMVAKNNQVHSACCQILGPFTDESTCLSVLNTNSGQSCFTFSILMTTFWLSVIEKSVFLKVFLLFQLLHEKHVLFYFILFYFVVAVVCLFLFLFIYQQYTRSPHGQRLK